MITIVMYHYVRPEDDSLFPQVNYLPLDVFEQQLQHLARDYQVISVDEARELLVNGDVGTGNYALLTFDDGYTDHLHYVAPLLQRYNMSGAFYAVACAARDARVLSVNKIHCLLSVDPDAQRLCQRMEAAMGGADEALDVDDFRRRFAVKNRWDSLERSYFKKMMQHGLPEVFRENLLAALFEELVPLPEDEVARRLYLSVEQLRQLVAAGHHVGGHSLNHVWLDKIDATALDAEIVASTGLLDAVYEDSYMKTFCYPFGGYSDAVVQALSRHGFELAFTVEPRVCSGDDSLLQLPRLDTNDFQRGIASSG